MRRSDLIPLAAALFCAVAAAADVEAAPARVVSLNVCTDQLAWLIGAPGQLVSVSPLAHDPRSAALAAEMADVPRNDASAEQVALMQPDLVLAGSYTARATVQMLIGLGYRVETFQPTRSLSDIRENITRMGVLLGRPARAAALVADFDARLATLSDAPETRPVVAYYLPFNETASGEGLTGDILHAAGMTTIAEALDLAPGETLPLERLVLAQPDMILVGAPYDSPAQATALLQHPALRATGKLHEIGPSAGWICGLPSTLDTVAEMRALRRSAQ
ncbi:ABC transporter substrate-binding protein [Citreicella sp. C3M06]|uniref:ABC transporter substrate-binding protein n=1 Tax=Citreicella sp. C3M06 TaxID=2841564 RepID=UPI001C08CC79|nr:ABC transporter substrate-binding protein [Citreicella sp. C3M06]